MDRNPGGPLTEKQARQFLESVLQAAIRQKAESILIDKIAGRPQVRLRLDGKFQELTGIGDEGSYRLLVAQARRSAGLAIHPDPGSRSCGTFLRLYRRGHLRNAAVRVKDDTLHFAFDEVSRKNRAVRFNLESITTPDDEIVKISLQPERPVDDTRFQLGFTAAAEKKYVTAVQSRSGIVLLTGPCNSGKSTATYHALSLLRDKGRKVMTVDWPREWTLPGVVQYWVREEKGWMEFDRRLDLCLRRAIQRRPDVLLLQNIDWIDDRAAQRALDYAALGGLLISAVHVQSCAWGLGSVLRRHFWNRRQEAADIFRAVVAPRRLGMVCMYCAEEYRVPGKVLVEAGMSDPPVAADGHVVTWRGRGCPLCEHSGQLGSIAVYEVLELTGPMKRFIENENDWDWNQVAWLERQAWMHGMRTQRELALERVLAGDISLQEAVLNTRKPPWLTPAQASGRLASGKAQP